MATVDVGTHWGNLSSLSEVMGWRVNMLAWKMPTSSGSHSCLVLPSWACHVYAWPLAQGSPLFLLPCLWPQLPHEILIHGQLQSHSWVK